MVIHSFFSAILWIDKTFMLVTMKVVQVHFVWELLANGK